MVGFVHLIWVGFWVPGAAEVFGVVCRGAFCWVFVISGVFVFGGVCCFRWLQDGVGVVGVRIRIVGGFVCGCWDVALRCWI